VKRCVAVSGDRVEIRDKRLYLNGGLVTGPFEHHIPDIGAGPECGPWPLSRDAGPINARSSGNWVFDPVLSPDSLHIDRQGMTPMGGDGAPYGFRDNLPPFIVPAGQILAMGDNRDNSLDSRYWGFVPVDHLRGRPFMVVWSYREGGSDDQSAKMPEGAGDVLMNYIDGARHFFTWSRWGRVGYMPQ